MSNILDGIGKATSTFFRVDNTLSQLHGGSQPTPPQQHYQQHYQQPMPSPQAYPPYTYAPYPPNSPIPGHAGHLTPHAPSPRSQPYPPQQPYPQQQQQQQQPYPPQHP
ncbi:hypothetical protein HK105_206242 [Polyrhizophydium stewartii]|uniref:Uncharacterized protein n=1 Tax=Polyrhizophydium stewartii TaxID=2732419 RepID=A0ABR4N442_9FUNG